MPQFAPGTDVCRTRVLLAAMAEYRVTSVLSDEGWLKEEQGRQSVQQEVEVGGCHHSTIRRHIPIAWEEFINSSHLETSPTPVPTLALVEIDIWCKGHVVVSEKTSTTDPG